MSITWLFSRAKAEGGQDGCYVMLRLSKLTIASLLAYRTEFERILPAFGGQLYCIESFDSTAEYLDAKNMHEDDRTMVDDYRDQWHESRTTTYSDDTDTKRMDACTLKITRDGVLWSASPHHSDYYVETPELPWSVLDNLAIVKRREEP